MSDAVQPDEITVPEKCPQCSKPGEQVDDTTIWHCDACGKTWDTAAVQPDEVTSTSIESRTVVDRRQEQAREELNAATHEALMGVDPIPNRDQFLTMAATANMLSQSAAAPPALRDPYVAFHVCMMGRALGLDPATAMNLIDAIGYDKQKAAKGEPQDKLQLSLSPELLVARVKMMGLGSVELLWASKTKAAAVALRPGGKVTRATKTDGLVCIGDIIEITGELGRVEFDWDMAEEAELTDDRCLWDPATDVVTHWKRPNTNGRGWSNNQPNGCKCGSYKKHPGRMMGWRAMGFCVHTYFPEASLGLYSPEELGAVVDDNGRAIDPTTVELPEGYETRTPSAGGRSAAAPPQDQQDPAAPYVIDWLKQRIAALPEEQRNTLKARWGEKYTEGRLPKFIDDLTERGANIAKALIAGQESIAKGTGWKPTVSTDEPTGPPEPGEADSTPSPQAPEAPQAPPGGPEPVSGGDPAPEAVEDPGGAPEQPSSDATAAPTTVFPTNEQLDQAIAYVGAMTEKQLNAGLRARTLDTKASERERRQALARVIANELAEEARAAEAE